MIDFVHADDNNIALVLVSHWIDNLYKLPKEYNTQKYFVGFCVNALKDGGINLDDDWDREILIINKALAKLYNPDVTVDTVYGYDTKDDEK